ncbi:MAG: metallophosphoesterase [Minisyncoccales bacterium]
MKIKMVLLILFILLIADIFYEVNFPKVNAVEIETDKIATGGEIKIVQITDLHNKRFFDNNKKLYDSIRELSPDIIVLTGDIIDRRTEDYQYVYSFIDELMKINPHVYYVLGNHELSHKNINEYKKELEARGVIMMDGRIEKYKGISIYGSSYYDKKYPELIDQSFSLLLTHDASLAISNYHNFDLVLSGHTHGGQARLPLIGAVYAPGQGFFPKHAKGLYGAGGEKVYIDSGLGNTFFPIRFLNQSQVSFIEIK